MLYAVNRTYADRGQALAEGDEVALIPPVSGGAFRLTHGPVNLTAVVVEVVDERAGAIATFLGTIRAQSRGRDVIALEYEAYEEMAEDVMVDIAGELGGATTCAGSRSRIGSGGSRSARRAWRSPSPRHTARTRSRLARRDRSAQGRGAALEEGVVRGRRGVDRPRLVTAQALRKYARHARGRLSSSRPRAAADY